MTFKCGKGTLQIMDYNWFKNRLAELGKTHATLADEVGLERTRVTKLLNGKGKKEFPVSYVEPFARALEVSVIEILKRAGLNVQHFEDPQKNLLIELCENIPANELETINTMLLGFRQKNLEKDSE